MKVNELEESMLTLIRLLSDGNAAWRKKVADLDSNLTAATLTINNVVEHFGLHGDGTLVEQLDAYIEEKTGGRDKLFERAVKDSLQLAKVLAEEEDELFKRAVKDRLRPVRFEELNPGKRYWRAFNRGKQARWECVELLEVEDTNALLVRMEKGFAGTLWVDMGSLYVTE